MAELTTLARPYANAVYELAKENDRIDAWGTALGLLVEAATSPELQAMLSSQVVGHQQKTHTLNELLRDTSAPEEVNRFVAVLAVNQRLDLLPDIAQLFEARRAEDSKTLDVTITSAVPLAADDVAKFEASLKQKFERDVAIETTVDPSVLGGAFIRAGDTVFDGTVRGKLAKMQEALTRA